MSILTRTALLKSSKIRKVQKKSNFATTTSLVVTLDAPTTVGNLLIARFCIARSEVNTTPPAGWTKAVSAVFNTNNNAAIYYKIADGTETTVTLGAATATVMGMVVTEYTGNHATPLDQVISNVTGTTTSISTGTTPTTTQADELLVSVAGTGAGQGAVSPWNNYFSPQFNTASQRLMAADDLVANVGTWESTVTWATAQAAGAAGAAMATFKAA